MNILVLNGPNLNLLGKREPDIYGHRTLEQIISELSNEAAACGAQISHVQSNAEHELVDAIQQVLTCDAQSSQRIHGIIINPGAFTHTSVAIRDALLAINTPFIEVHLSNVYARESFRQHSYLSDIASGVIVGCGELGYKMALQSLMNKLA